MASKFKYLLALHLMFIGVFAFAQNDPQQVIASQGDNNTAGTVQLSWTIGQVIAASGIASGYTLTEGFHQVDQVVTILTSAPEKQQIITFYPNPTVDFVSITTPKKAVGSYELINLDGRIITSEDNVDFASKQEIPMHQLASGIYLLTIYTQDQVKRVKIVKQ